MKENAGILQQAKFIGLILQMIAVSIIYETRAAHIKASLPFGYEDTSDEYIDMERRLNVVCIAFWIMGLIEFVIIFWGQTLFNSQVNLLMVFAHVASCMILIDFKNRIAHVDNLSVTVVLAGCGPMVLELASALMTFSNYRRKDAGVQ